MGRNVAMTQSGLTGVDRRRAVSGRRAATPVSLLTACLLMVAGVVVGNVLVTPPTAAAAPIPTLQQAGWDPSWKKIPELKAVWLGTDGRPVADGTRVLSDQSVYWTSDNSTGNPGSAVGNRVMMLGESYDFTPDASSYKTRPVMAFERTATGTLTMSTLSGYLQYSTLAMARIGGTRTNPDGPFSMYFWAHDASNYINSTSFLDCGKISGLGSGGWNSVVRVTDGSPDIYVGCMAGTRAGSDWKNMTPGSGWHTATGGEGDQLTGYLYIQNMWGSLDDQSQTSTSINGSTQQFTIWDPTSGSYVQSGPVQPQDLVVGSISRDRLLLDASVSDAACPYGTDGKGRGCTYAYASMAADFGLDATGSIYIYAGASISANNTQRGNSSIVRIVPTRDGAGNFVNGSQAQPWTYRVVKKLTPSRADFYIDSGQWMVGTGVHNGKLLGSGYVNAFYNNDPDAAMGNNAGTADSKAVASESETASRMVRLNPVSGVMDLVGPQSTADNAVVVDSNNASGYIMSQVNGRDYRDNASPQMLTVINGTVYNDQAADGSVAGDPGLPDQTMALYTSDGVLAGTQTTGSDGGYYFVVSGNGDYYVRLVQPQVAGFNAIQTYGAAADTVNDVMMACTNGNLRDGQSGECAGALALPYTDPAVTALGMATDLTTTPIYARVTMNSDSELATVDFGVSALGSYGDAAAGPATGPDAPVHINGTDPGVWLGATLGSYTGPATDGTAHAATDDGVYIDTAGGKLPLAGSVLAATGTYQLAADVSGPAAGTAQLAGWVTGAGNATWNTAAKWTPTVTGNVAKGNFQFQTSGLVTGTPAVQFRANVSPVAQAQPTNALNDYQASATSGTLWTTPGEVEDYAFTIADTVYRAAAHTTGGTATVTVDGQTITAKPATVVAPVSKGAKAATSVSVAATAPANWQIVGATIVDTKTGAVLATPTVTAGTTATITFTSPALGGDVTVDVAYAPVPDPAQSTLTLDPPNGTTGAGLNVTATASVVDANRTPLTGITVTFTNKSQPTTTLSAPTCVTVNGVCAVTITSATAGTYTDELAATVPVNSQARPITNSPQTVTFTAGGLSVANSTFTVAPTANLANQSTWRTADGVASYTGTLTAHDATNNPVTGLTLADISFTASRPDIVVTDVTDVGDGTYTVTYTSKVAGTATASLTYKHTPIGTSAPVPFAAGAPSTGPFTNCPAGLTGTSLSVDKTQLAAGQTAAATVLVTDQTCNPLSGVAVTFTLDPGTNASLVTTLGVTGADGKATATVTDLTAETATLRAAIPAGEISSAKNITFTAGAFNAARSAFAVTPVVTPGDPSAWPVADGIASYTGLLTARDANGNPVTTLTAGDLVFSAPATVTVSPVTTGGDGMYQVTYTSTMASATPTASVRVQGTSVGTALPVPFQAGAPADGPVLCSGGRTGTSLTASPATLTVGELSTVTALVTDRNCNPVAGATVTFTASGGDLGATTGTTGANGQVTTTLGETTPETVTVNATATKAGPTVAVGTADVTFEVGVLSPADSVFTVDPAVDLGDPSTWVTADGVGAYTATLAAKDANGNPLTGLALADISFAASGTGIVVSGVTDHHDGTYTATYVTTVASASPVATVTYQGTPVGAALPIPFRAGPPSATCPDPAKVTSVTVTPYQVGVGVTATATALITDQYCNAVAGWPVTFTVDGAATLAPTATVFTDAEGKAVVQVTDDQPETVTVTAAAGGAEVTAQVTYELGGFSPTESDFEVSLDTTGQAVGDGSYTLTLTARDSNGVPLTDLDEADISFTVSNQYYDVSPIANGGDGTYTVTITSDVADAAATATVTYQGSPVAAKTGAHAGETQLPVPFVAGAASANPACVAPYTRGTGVMVTPASLPVAGLATVTALVTDQFCNPLAGADVTLVPDGAATVAPATAQTTGADGTVTATVTDTTAEAVTVTATTPEITAGTTSVTFTTGPVALDLSTFTVTPDATQPANVQTADGTAYYTATLTALDAYGNPVTNLDVATIEFAASATYIAASDVTNEGDGRYTVRLTSTVADAAATETVTVDGDLVGEALPVPFQAGAPAAATVCPSDSPYLAVTGLAADRDSLPVGQTANVFIVITDAYCNPVAGATVDVTAAGVGAAVAPTPVTTDAGGEATTQVTASARGVVTVTALIGAVPFGETDVEFTLGAASAATSAFTVDPAVDPGDDSGWPVAGAGSYTGTLTAKDSDGNVLPDLDLGTIQFPGLESFVTVGAIDNQAGGVYVVTFTSKVADPSLTVTVAVAGTSIGTAQPIPFAAGAPALHPVCPLPGEVGTHLAVVPDRLPVGESATVTAYVTDVNCNPVGEEDVLFALAAPTQGSLDETAVTTGVDGYARVLLMDAKAESVGVGAEIAAGALTDVTVTFYDENPPVAPTITTPAAGLVTNAASLVIAGDSGQAGATVTVTAGGTTVCTATVAADGPWSCTATLAEGTYDLVATQTNAAGTESD
ncbi:MAG: Ig-like domain-containing protein, partial [Propionibacteriaceae bacterium]|nr:Ig-like domain-containing protein [Propionibacteriaceae bacterium]